MPQQFTCSACAFQVRSDDEDELISHVQDHADHAHDMDMSAADVREGMEESPMEH
jgi:predicted small metal-binding protein